MYLLAGVFGMMALASLAIAGMALFPADPPAGKEADPGPFPPGALHRDAAGKSAGDVSLFARMGIIDLPWPQTLAGTARAPGPRDALPLPAFGVTPAACAPLLEYDADEDRLVVIYDDSAGGVAPQLALTARVGHPEITDILAGGRVLASLPTASAPPLSAVFLMGERAAVALAPI